MQFIPVQLVPTWLGPTQLGPIALLCALCLLAVRLLSGAGRVPVLAAPPVDGSRREPRGMLLSEARADGPWEDAGPLATGQAREEAERAEAEAELRRQISEWASEVAGRIAEAPRTAPRADAWSEPGPDPTGSGR
ncbi:hypothetical protein ACH4D5_06595 [Streptomyces sp. NPDC018029]|uniref:hypothetical protein n=1 Tax=Streptomyces sp. NPDC018029 TaxID=3365032 RepID=UPI00379735BA